MVFSFEDLSQGLVRKQVISFTMISVKGQEHSSDCQQNIFPQKIFFLP